MMRSLQIVHDISRDYWTKEDAVVGFGAGLAGKQFDYIDYEVPRTDDERRYIQYVVLARIAPGGIVNEVDPPR